MGDTKLMAPNVRSGKPCCVCPRVGVWFALGRNLVINHGGHFLGRVRLFTPLLPEWLPSDLAFTFAKCLCPPKVAVAAGTDGQFKGGEAVGCRGGAADRCRARSSPCSSDISLCVSLLFVPSLPFRFLLFAFHASQ